MNKKPTIVSLHEVGIRYWQQHGYFRRSPYWALESVTFDLRQGESLGIIGRNGVGKSSLLRVLAGILSPDRGHIINHGARIALLSLQIGFVPHLTGRQNALLSGMLLGLSKRQVEQKMQKIKAFSELEDFFEQPLHTYSSGMRARLGFSTAFQLDPDVLLIDEVLGVGDEEFRQKSSTIMRQKIRSEKTIVLVSHNLNVLRQLCDRAVWIENKTVHLVGDVETVLSAYEAQLRKPKRAALNLHRQAAAGK